MSVMREVESQPESQQEVGAFLGRGSLLFSLATSGSLLVQHESLLQAIASVTSSFFSTIGSARSDVSFSLAQQS